MTKLLESGRYQNANDMIREGIRLIERQETEDELRLKTLREATDVRIADIEAGRFRGFDTINPLHGYLAAQADDALAKQP